MPDTATRPLCNVCFKKRPAPNRKSCPACLKRNRDAFRKRSDARKAQGLCVRCGMEPPRPGKTECGACTERYRARNNGRSYAEYVRKRYWARIDAGLCAKCGKAAPVDGGRNCDPCRQRARQIDRKNKAKRFAAGLCADCSQPAEAGRRLCARCAGKHRHYNARWETLPVWSPTYTVYDLKTGASLGTWESREDVALCLAFAKRSRDEVEIVRDAPLHAAYAGSR